MSRSVSWITLGPGRRSWLVWVIVGVLVTGAYLAVEPLEAMAALVLALAGSSFAAVVVGMKSHHPHATLGWTLLAAAAGAWFVGRTFRQSYIVAHDGRYPSPDSWRTIVFLTLYPAFGGALLYLLRRREGGVAALIDTAIVGCSLVVVVWPTLLVKYLADDVPASVAAVQIAFAFADIAMLALFVRVLLSPGRRTPALWLLAASGACYLVSNGLWNWSTEMGHHSPGSWADAGWMLFPVGLAAAALHPSMRSLFASHSGAERTGTSTRVLLLIGAVLIAPVSHAVDAFRDNNVDEILVAAVAAATVGVLVVLRLALILRERRSLAARLESQNEELIELDRLKDDFIASVSHELRTPLTSIRGYLDLVREGEAGPLTDDQERFLGIVDRNADRLLRVVSDLLFVAQVGAGKLDLSLEDVEIGQLVEHAAETARPHAESNELELVAEVQPMAPLSVDRARLGQALDNLVSNAIKFTPAGGRVVVRAFPADGNVVLEVADTGFGMSPAEQGRLFERFYRAAAASEHAIQGTGLGLTIVEAIAEAHGGTITVQSAEGAGTTFRILLPVIRT